MLCIALGSKTLGGLSRPAQQGRCVFLTTTPVPGPRGLGRGGGGVGGGVGLGAGAGLRGAAAAVRPAGSELPGRPGALRFRTAATEPIGKSGVHWLGGSAK
jgi:hypothetical protein